MDVEKEYTVLAVLEFNSNRKRQSVIVREPSGRIVLYIKVCSLPPGITLTRIGSLYLQESGSRVWMTIEYSVQ